MKRSENPSSRTIFKVSTIGVVCGDNSTKQKTQELGCLRSWLTDHEVVPHTWSSLVYQKNLFM